MAWQVQVPRKKVALASGRGWSFALGHNSAIQYWIKFRYAQPKEFLFPSKLIDALFSISVHYLFSGLVTENWTEEQVCHHSTTWPALALLTKAKYVVKMLHTQHNMQGKYVLSAKYSSFFYYMSKWILPQEAEHSKYSRSIHGNRFNRFQESQRILKFTDAIVPDIKWYIKYLHLAHPHPPIYFKTSLDHSYNTM